MKPDFDTALNAHFAAISNRDIEAFKWRIVHDQNTALDFHAFARVAGIEKTANLKTVRNERGCPAGE